MQLFLNSISTTNIMVPVRGTLLGSLPSLYLPSSSSSSPVPLICNFHLKQNLGYTYGSCGLISTLATTRRRHYDVNAASFSDAWKPDKAASSPSLSDVLWPSAGAFAAMALLGKMDQILAPKGLSMTIAPLGAVCAVLFTAPSSPAARKYNMFMSQIGCAAIGVLALATLGPGWFARSIALAASIAFMILTRSTHPPAASLPILFIDGAKLHHLNIWFAFFPGAAGCILLCLIQEMVCYLKDNAKF